MFLKGCAFNVPTLSEADKAKIWGYISDKKDCVTNGARIVFIFIFDSVIPSFLELG